MVEVVADRDLDRGEYLQASHPAEPQHRPLPPAKWQVRVLGTVARPPAGLPAPARCRDFHRRAAGPQAIRHDRHWLAIPLHRFLQEFQGNLAVARLCHEASRPRPRGRPPATDKCVRPLIFTNTSSRCQRQRLDRIAGTRRRRISAANSGPNRRHQNPTVSWLISTPRSWRSLFFRITVIDVFGFSPGLSSRVTDSRKVFLGRLQPRLDLALGLV